MSLFSNIFYKVRKLLYIKNERGEPTGDILRYLVRRHSRKLLQDKKGLIIDIGCGEGYLLESMLKDKARRAVLFDNEEKMIRTAVSAYHPELKEVSFPVIGDARQFPFKSSVFDIAICINTFYNFPSRTDVSESIHQISRLLKPGGSIIFDVRNKANPFVKRAYQNARCYDPSIGDLPLNAYTFNEIKDILSQTELSINRTKGLVLPFKAIAPIILLEVIK